MFCNFSTASRVSFLDAPAYGEAQRQVTGRFLNVLSFQRRRVSEPVVGARGVDALVSSEGPLLEPTARNQREWRNDEAIMASWKNRRYL